MCGYSMGGYGTILHSMLEPERFAAVGYFSPGVFPPAKDTDADRPLRRHLQYNGFDLAEQAAQKGAKLPAIFLCIGENDFLYEAVQQFHAHLDRLGIAHRYDALPGFEHEFAIWDLELEKFMDWLPRTDYYADKIPHKI